MPPFLIGSVTQTDTIFFKFRPTGKRFELVNKISAVFVCYVVQSTALRKQLAYVGKNSAFYRDKFSVADFDINDVKNIDDLKKLPFTVKQELRDSLAKQKPLGRHAAMDLIKCEQVMLLQPLLTRKSAG